MRAVTNAECADVAESATLVGSACLRDMASRRGSRVAREVRRMRDLGYGSATRETRETCEMRETRVLCGMRKNRRTRAVRERCDTRERREMRGVRTVESMRAMSARRGAGRSEERR